MTEHRGGARGRSGRSGPGNSGSRRQGPPAEGKGKPRRNGPPPKGKPRRDGPPKGKGKPRPKGLARRGKPGERRRDDDRRANRFGDAPKPTAGPLEWGGLARQGAARLEEQDEFRDGLDDGPAARPPPDVTDDPEAAARYEARQEKRARGEANRARLRDEAQAAIARSGTRAPQRKAAGPRDRAALVPKKLPDPKRQLMELLGDSAGKRAWRDLNQAAEHVDAGRAADARSVAARLYKRAPEVLEVTEIYGLSLYGLGRWHDAVEILEEVRERSGVADQNPVLADAHRALGNWADVAYLWDELRNASPSSEVMTEGRIVAAGALADQGDLQGAVRLLSQGWKRPKRPFEHHLRRAYALADLYERAGEAPRAKELFGWITHHDASYFDAAQRAR